MYSGMMALLSGAVLLLFLASNIVGAFSAAVLIGLVAAGVTSPLRWYTLITMAGRLWVKSGHR